MFSVRGVAISALFGSAPALAQDNAAFLAKSFDPAKVASIVKSTGFSIRRSAAGRVSALEMALAAAREALRGEDVSRFGGIVFVTFSAARRYPSCAQLAHGRLGLPADAAALDIQLACSGYPYGLFVAAQLAASTGRKVLLLDGDVQTEFLDPSDLATNAVMGDGASATVVEPGGGEWRFAFLTDPSGAGALECPAAGPVAMRGYEVFRFATGGVAAFLREFAAACPARPGEFFFAPHQANLYMIRQLAVSIGVPAERLLVSGDRYGNPGSASVAQAIAASADANGQILLAGFGAGLSAAAAFGEISADCRRGMVEC